MLKFVCTGIAFAFMLSFAHAAEAIVPSYSQDSFPTHRSVAEHQRELSQEALDKVAGEQLVREVQQRAALMIAREQIVDQQKALDEINAKLVSKMKELDELTANQHPQCQTQK